MEANQQKCATAKLGPYLSLKDVDFWRSPSHIGAIRVDRTGMRFAFARTSAQPLAWQVGENVFVTGITSLECSLGATIVCLVLWELNLGG